MAHYDVIIIGTGAGGGTLARHLAPSGKHDPAARARRLAAARAPERLGRGGVRQRPLRHAPTCGATTNGEVFQPQVHYFVGGATKMYGAALYRLRAEDFGELRHHDGISPAWPIGYDEMEPYYTLAERYYHVHGARGEDPTEPPASAPYPFPAVSHEPRIQKLSDDLATHRPPSVPRAVRRDARREQHAVQRVHALRQLRRLPVHRPRQVRRRGARRAARVASIPNVELVDRLRGHAPEHQRRRHRGHRRHRRPRRRQRDASAATSSSSPAAPPTRRGCC